MAKRLTPKQRAQAETALTVVQEMQTRFWDALKHLETLLGVDLDSTDDYEGVSITDVRRKYPS